MTHGARNYAIVTAAYWGFTLTDGALRMLVLLHFFQLGYSPFTLAFLFLLYEAAGIAANFIGGWLATRFGITRMLTVGLTTQITGFLVLSALSPDWAAALSVAWVVAAQGICGVAKDLTKTASKSAIKVAEKEARAEDSEGRLFRWVAWFTGSKNAMKGVGFFLGGVLLQVARLPPVAVGHGGGCLAIILLGVVFSLPPMMGKAKASSSARELFGKSKRHQPACRRSRCVVRRAGRVVRRGRAGVSLCQWLDLHHGRRLHGRVDDLLRPDPGVGTRRNPPEQRRALTGSAGCKAVVRPAGSGSSADDRGTQSRQRRRGPISSS